MEKTYSNNKFLGVWQSPGWGNWVDDLNTIHKDGLFAFQSNAQHIPSDFEGVGVVLSIRQSAGVGAYGVQIVAGLNNNKFYIRTTSDGDSWLGWFTISVS